MITAHLFTSDREPVRTRGTRTARRPSMTGMSIRRGVPFRGSAALAAGLITRSVLYGPRYEQLLPDIHVSAGTERTLLLRSWAAAARVGTTGVLSGYSAAEVLRASCGPRDAPAEVTMLDGHRLRSRPGLVVHHGTLGPEDVVRCRGVRVTSPARTANDLARWAPDLVEAVVGVDAVCHRYELDPAVVLVARPGARGEARLPQVRRLVDACAESPMESRIRVAVVSAGLPAPVLQHAVLLAGGRYRLDLCYPDAKLVIEYNGAEHRTARRAHHDLLREQLLAAAGWRIVRFTAAEVLHRPDVVARIVARELRSRA